MSLVPPHLLTSPLALLRLFHPEWKITGLVHRSWDKEYTRLRTGEHLRAIIAAPLRGSKTTYWSEGTVCFNALTIPNCRQLITGYGREFLREKWPEITELIRSAAPHYGVSISEQTTDHILLSNSSFIKIISISGAIEASGWDWIYADDITKDINAAQSETQRRALSQRFFGTLMQRRRTMDMRVVVVSARRHPQDCSGLAMQQNTDSTTEREKWHYLKTIAIEDGKSYWPEKWPVDFLLQEREKLYNLAEGAWIWENSYMQNEINPALIKWSPECFPASIWYDGVLPCDPQRCAMALDWAWGGGDDAACLVGYLGRDGLIYVDAAHLADMPWDSTINAVVNLGKSHKLQIFGAEINAKQDKPVKVIKDRLREFYPQGLATRDFDSEGNKFIRCVSYLDQPITNKMFRFRKIQANKKGVNEIMAFSKDTKQHDDYVDGLCMLYRLLKNE